MFPAWSLVLVVSVFSCAAQVSVLHAEPAIVAEIPASTTYHIPLPFTDARLDGLSFYLSRYLDHGFTPDAYLESGIKAEPGLLHASKYIRIPLDPHIRGPLLDEIEAAFSKANPGTRFRLYRVFDDCNLCRVPDGREHCTLMGCDDQWWTFLYIRRRRPGEAALAPLVLPSLVFDWTEYEMRERWQPSLEPETFPFPTHGPGDRPPVRDP